MKEIFVLLKFFDLVESIDGRKKLQKIIYILESCGYSFPFKYEYHYYGPYSAQLQEQVSYLAEQGFITEEYRNNTYIYKITEKGEKLNKVLENTLNYNFSINPELLKILNKKNPQYLEMVSTYLFLLDSSYKPKEAEEKAKELKPHLSEISSEAFSFANEVIANDTLILKLLKK